ncbi:MAG TPA: hypothetical protein VER17_14300 [Tepidisphaeraceae bacterium]|nr:hypothetical protein [Tepidisphaeraceae bacterium]
MRPISPFRKRRGITAVLAMLFMILIATLSLGFYASVTTSVSIAKNDQRGARALLAAESGIQFMRYHLANTNLPSDTQPNQVLAELEADLKSRLEGTANLGTCTVAKVGNTISIPAEAGKYIVTNPDDGSGFTVSITDTGAGAGGEIVCTVMGQTGGGSYKGSRAVRLDFTRAPVTTSIYDNAIAARGKILIQKGGVTRVDGVSSYNVANIMSARTSSPALVMTGGTIGGYDNSTTPADEGGSLGALDKNWVQVYGGTVHGTSNIPAIQSSYTATSAAPAFPSVDTDYFAPFATNTYANEKGGIIKNIRIPANTNPKFTSNTTIQGIIYIESPNNVEFKGTTELQGMLVFENDGTVGQNVVTMSGNFAVGSLPQGAEFNPLRTITGLSVVAPSASLYMTGSVDSQFRGNVIVGTFRNGGSADVVLDQGSIVAMDTTVDSVVLNGKMIKVKSTGKLNQPSSAAITYDKKFIPSKGSYLELN